MQTMMFELQSIEEDGLKIIELKTQPRGGSDEKVTNVIQCLPKAPKYFKVDFKNRLAPLIMKFKYFDLYTGEKKHDSDVLIC